MRTRLVLVLVLVLGASSPALAQSASSTEVDPAAGLARAIELYEKRDFRSARPLLEAAAAEPGAPEVAHLYLALTSFGNADDEAAARHLARVGTASPLRQALEACLEGPFRARLRDAAFLTEGRTAHYHLTTDVGCDPALVQAATAELEKLASDPEKNAKRLEKLKAKRSRGFEEIGSLLERIYAEYSAMFKFEKDEKLVPRVYVFDRREDFLEFSRRLGPGGDGAAGYYWPALRILVVDAADVGEQRGVLRARGMTTIFHEAFHQFLDYYVEGAPHWFNEGIAEYFGPSLPVAGQRKLTVGVVVKTYPGGHPTRYQVLQGALKAGAYPAVTPLRKLVELERHAFMDPEKVGVHYAQAWAFIHYLANRHPKGKKMLVDYFNALRRGEGRRAAHEAAFKDVDWDKVEADWKAYVQKL